MPRGGSCEEQVADVGAGDQQNETSGDEQQQQCLANVRHHLFIQRNDGGRPFFVPEGPRAPDGEPCSSVQLPLGLPRPLARGAQRPGRCSCAGPCAPPGSWRRAPTPRDHSRGIEVWPERRRSQCGRRCSTSRTAQSIEDPTRIGAARGRSSGPQPADSRIRPRLQERCDPARHRGPGARNPRRRSRAGDSLGSGCRHQIEGDVLDGLDLLESACLALGVQKCRWRQELPAAGANVRSPDTDQPLWFGIRQGTEHDRVHDAEDHRTGADPQPNRQDGDGGEPGNSPQDSEGVADILPGVFEGSQPLLVTIGFGRRIAGSQFAPRLAARLVEWQPGASVSSVSSVKCSASSSRTRSSSRRPSTDAVSRLTKRRRTFMPDPPP